MRRLIYKIAVIMAAPMLLGACANSENASAEASSIAATEAVTTEATRSSSEQTSEESEQTDSQLTTYLQYIEDNFCSDAYAGYPKGGKTPSTHIQIF